MHSTFNPYKQNQLNFITRTVNENAVNNQNQNNTINHITVITKPQPQNKFQVLKTKLIDLLTSRRKYETYLTLKKSTNFEFGNGDQLRKEFQFKIDEFTSFKTTYFHKINKLERKKRWKQNKKEKEKEAQVEKEKKIDAWQLNWKQKQEVEKKQLEEHRNQTLELRKVNQKQAKVEELKKMLSQLNQIKKLRKQKLIKLGQYTENNSEDDNAFFNKIKNEAENLTNYNKDEVEEDIITKSDRINADNNNKKRIDYNMLCAEYYKSSNKDIPSLIKIRTKWDKYLTYNKKGNSLPLGWPEVKSPTNGWEKYFL